MLGLFGTHLLISSQSGDNVFIYKLVTTPLLKFISYIHTNTIWKYRSMFFIRLEGDSKSNSKLYILHMQLIF